MELEHLFPDAARQMLDYVDEVIHIHGADMSEAGIARMSDELARRGGGNPTRGHNQNTLNDLARLLILQRLIEQGGFPIFPYPPFFFFPPTVPIHRPIHRPRPPVRPVPPIHRPLPPGHRPGRPR